MVAFNFGLAVSSFFRAIIMEIFSKKMISKGAIADIVSTALRLNQLSRWSKAYATDVVLVNLRHTDDFGA